MYKSQHTSVDERLIEKAIVFMADALTNKSLGSKSKPVIFHSIRVGMLLWQNGASQDSIVAGFLHDLIEDSQVGRQEIANVFGDKVASLVEAMTFDHGSHNYEEKLVEAIDSHRKTIALGAEASCIRACDLVDNSDYYKFADSPELKSYLHKKFVTFIDLAQPQLKGTSFWNLLQITYEQNVKPLA
jgi:(p)ppGpp synthase/HD superfamily hydrolase